MPKGSIIVPNYNHANYLSQRIYSILNQTYQDFEVILLDDCSTDNSREVILSYKEDPKVTHVVFNEENSGNTFKQWERGVKLAKGEYIWIAESDDYCDEKFLENAVNELEQNTNVGLVYCQSWKVNESNTIIDSWFDWTKDLDRELFRNNFTYNGINFIENFLVYKNIIPNASAVVFRKAIYDNVGGVNFNIKYCGDWFLWLKIAAVSDISFIAESLNYFRYHQNSVIYKAVNISDNDGIYPEKYQITMRKIFANWVKCKKINMPNVLPKNNYYISQEYLLQTAWYSKNNKRLLSVYTGMIYFFLSKDILFLKRVLKKGIKLFNRKR